MKADEELMKALLELQLALEEVERYIRTDRITELREIVCGMELLKELNKRKPF